MQKASRTERFQDFRISHPIKCSPEGLASEVVLLWEDFNTKQRQMTNYYILEFESFEANYQGISMKIWISINMPEPKTVTVYDYRVIYTGYSPNIGMKANQAKPALLGHIALL